MLAGLEKDFDYKLEALQPWPYPYYQALLRRCRAVPGTKHGGFHAILGREEVIAAAREVGTFSSRGGVNFPFVGRADRPAQIPIEIDPPEHTAYRRLIQPRFGSSILTAIEPKIRSEVERLIAPLRGRRSGDLAKALALPLPSASLAIWMGLPVEEGQRLKAWADARIAAIQGEDKPAIDEILAQMRSWLLALIKERRAQATTEDGPADLISYLLAQEIDGRLLDEKEIMGYTLIMVFAGHETTSAGIANALWYLSTDLPLQSRLRSDPGLIPDAVEELLRLDPPVQAMGRTATRDVEVAGCSIKRGDPVLLVWAAANYDESALTNPAEFVLGRRPPHLSFGSGVHRCVGAPLARLQMVASLEAVLTGLPPFAPDPGSAVDHEFATYHHINSLPVVFDA